MDRWDIEVQEMVIFSLQTTHVRNYRRRHNLSWFAHSFLFFFRTFHSGSPFARITPPLIQTVSFIATVRLAVQNCSMFRTNIKHPDSSG